MSTAPSALDWYTILLTSDLGSVASNAARSRPASTSRMTLGSSGIVRAVALEAHDDGRPCLFNDHKAQKADRARLSPAGHVEHDPGAGVCPVFTDHEPTTIAGPVAFRKGEIGERCGVRGPGTLTAGTRTAKRAGAEPSRPPSGDPYGNRTRVFAVRGRRPDR